MKKLLMVFVFLFAASFSFADVGEEAPKGEAKPAAQVEPQQAEPVMTSEVYAGQDVVINLLSNRTTGYQWQLADPLDETILKLAGSEYIAPNTDRVGAPGKEVWTFKTLRAGETTISFRYVRPWEKAAEATPKGVFKVVVKEKPATQKEAVVTPIAPHIIKGKVDELNFADLLTKPNPDITILTEEGKKVKFVVKPSAVVYDADGTPLSLRQVSVGDNVSVNYRCTKEANEAAGIKLIDKNVE